MSGSKLSDATSFRSKNGPPEDHPLGLTVHNLPTPEQAMDSARRRTVMGRWKMLGVLLTCAAPVIASYFTYYVVRPQGRANLGELIEPQRPLPDQAVVGLDGQPGNLRSLKGQWLLVSVAGGACDAACQKHLYLQRQLRETLGKEKDRVDWVWLVTDDAPIAEALRPALKTATVLRVGELQLSQWLSPAVGQLLPDHLYVVDPMGNWMMRFPAGLDIEGASKAKRDLDRLLRGSNSWDDAGR
jgi:hypothetical protein|nr:hypothetical protein [uncultured Albidiferax sp.]